MKTTGGYSGARESYRAFDLHEINRSTEPSNVRVPYDDPKMEVNPSYAVCNYTSVDGEPVYETADRETNYT